MSHNKLITNIAAFDTYFSSQQRLHELENDAPNVFTQTRVGEAEVERFRGSDGNVGVHMLEAEEERGADGEAGAEDGEVDRALVAVDAGGEGGVVARGEGVGGIGEEGGERGGAVVDGGELPGSAADVSGCAQRQRVLADQELDNGEVAVVTSSVMKGRVPSAASDGQQAPLPRVELGIRDHHLNESQWRRAATGEHDGSHARMVLALVE